MRATDTTAIRAAMHAEARPMTAAVGPEGERLVVESPLDRFLTSGAAAPVDLDEQLADDSR